ncbi:hypothetical protein [Lysobacter sp. A378]
MTSPQPPAKPQDIDIKSRNRNRIMLVAIFALFFGSAAVAGFLRFSGWQPEGSKNHGEVLQPPADLREVIPQLVDGGTYEWNPDARTWRIALAPPTDCGAECAELARDLDKVWRLFGKDADRLHILWICDSPGCMPPAAMPLPRTLRQLQPDPRLLAGLPGVDDPAGVPVYVIDPNGFVIMRFEPGFDAGGLRSDLATLFKLI